MTNAWYNFRTQQMDYIETPDDFSDYVPQIDGLGLYKIYVEHKGMKPIEAAVKVLKIAYDKEQEQPHD